MPICQKRKRSWSEAITHNRVALALAPKNAGYRSNLARNHTHLADILVRLNDHPAATKAAAEVLKIAPTGWQEYQRGAHFTCQSMALLTKDAKLTDAQRKDTLAAYGTQAVHPGSKLVQHGYFDAVALKQEPAFAPLRDRPDFQKLLSKLEGKAP